MKQLIKIKTIALLLLPLMLTCFALLPSAQAVTSPDVITSPDETFPNFNTAAGLQALLSLTTGISNTAYGARALRANTTGGSNLGIGGFALINNTDGDMNTAVGNNAMFSNQHGDNNMALGQGALSHNVSGSRNVAMGAQALGGNTADGNVAIGYQAAASNTGGTPNLAVGTQALATNTDGIHNTAIGFQALFSNIDSFNTAIGEGALFSHSTANSNVAVGFEALASHTAGSGNIALGTQAGNNLVTGNVNIYIGNPGVNPENGTIRIGQPTGGAAQTATFIAGILGQSVPSGVPVLIGTNHQLGTTTPPSSARFKEEIKPMDKASEAILALKPVTFRYKQDVDPTGTPQFGLIAEDVEKVNPDLVGRDLKGELNTVRYEAVNAMLLNEFLKAHSKMEERDATITQLKSTVAQQQKDFQTTAARQQKQIDALSVGLQKVSAQVEASKSAPQIVVNDQ
jgi:hypothetical protein